MMNIILRTVNYRANHGGIVEQPFPAIGDRSRRIAIAIQANELAPWIGRAHRLFTDEDRNLGGDFRRQIDECRMRNQVQQYQSGIFNVQIIPENVNNQPRYWRFARQIIESLGICTRLHLTIFGNISNTFPEQTITGFLNEFLWCARKLECCWDIDERYVADMCALLGRREYRDLTRQNGLVVTNEENFQWTNIRSNDISSLRAAQISERRMSINRNLGEFEMPTRENIGRILPNASGAAGEHYALSLFIRKGFIAGMAPANTRDYDLVMMSQDSLRFYPIQVKTVTDARHWILSQSHEDVIENLLFCFVRFERHLNDGRVFLIPAARVADVIRRQHEIYMSLPGRDGEPRSNTAMRPLKMDYSDLTRRFENPGEYLTRQQLQFIRDHSLGWLDEYENNFPNMA